VHGQVMTPTARYADLLLPATTFLENRDLYTGYGHFQMAVVDRVVEPVGEARSNFDLFQALAGKLGYTEKPFRQSIEDRLSSYIATIDGLPEDFSYTEGMATGWLTSTRRRQGESVLQRWKVPYAFRGKVEPQVPEIPCLLEATECADKDLAARFPFLLITPPHKDLLNSTFGERYPEMVGEVLIHPEDAVSRHIPDGARVRLCNHRGWVVRVARLTEDTQRGLLVAEGIFWQTEAFSAGINDVTSQKTTDIGAGPTFHESRVAVELLIEDER